MRRTANISLIANEFDNDLTNINSIISINKKIEVLIGFTNHFEEYSEFPVLWFPQGIFLINAASISYGNDGVTISLTLHDKMALLNGECGGVLPATVNFHEIEEQDSYGNITITKPTIVQIIQQLVNHWGNEDLGKIIIKDLQPSIKQVLKWNGESPLYIYANAKEFPGCNTVSPFKSIVYKNIYKEQYLLGEYPQQCQSASLFNTLQRIDKNFIIKNNVIKYGDIVIANINENKKSPITVAGKQKIVQLLINKATENIQQAVTKSKKYSNLKQQNQYIIFLKNLINKLTALQQQLKEKDKVNDEWEKSLTELKNTIYDNNRSTLQSVLDYTNLWIKNIEKTETDDQYEGLQHIIRTAQNQVFLKKEKELIKKIPIQLRTQNAISSIITKTSTLKNKIELLLNIIKTERKKYEDDINQKKPHEWSSVSQKWINKDGKEQTLSVKVSPKNLLKFLFATGPTKTKTQLTSTFSINISKDKQKGTELAFFKEDQTGRSMIYKKVNKKWQLYKAFGTINDKPSSSALSLCYFQILRNASQDTGTYYYPMKEICEISNMLINYPFKRDCPKLPSLENKIFYLLKEDSISIDQIHVAVTAMKDWCTNILEFFRGPDGIDSTKAEKYPQAIIKRLIQQQKSKINQILNPSSAFTFFDYSFDKKLKDFTQKLTKDKKCHSNENSTYSYFSLSQTISHYIETIEEIIDLLPNGQKKIKTATKNYFNDKIKLKLEQIKNYITTDLYTVLNDTDKFVCFKYPAFDSWEDRYKENSNARKFYSPLQEDVVMIKNHFYNTLLDFKDKLTKMMEDNSKYLETQNKNHEVFLLKTLTINDTLKSLNSNRNKLYNTYFNLLKQEEKNLQQPIENIEDFFTKTSSKLKDLSIDESIAKYTTDLQNYINVLNTKQLNNIESLTACLQRISFYNSETLVEGLKEEIDKMKSAIFSIEQLSTFDEDEEISKNNITNHIVEHKKTLIRLQQKYDKDFCNWLEPKDREKSAELLYNSIKDNIKNIKTVNPSEDAGYILTDFIYPGELIGQAGESVTSILDKIKNTLGNFEYFYDINGNFVFQEIKNYLNTSYSTYILKENSSPYYNYNNVDGKIVYDFSEQDLIQSYSSSPQYNQIKNDFVVWGEKTTADGKKYPIRYHLAIDTKPQVGNIYCFTYPLLDVYNAAVKKKDGTINKLYIQKKVIDNNSSYKYYTDFPLTGVPKTVYYYAKYENAFYEWHEPKIFSENQSKQLKYQNFNFNKYDQNNFKGYKKIQLPTDNVYSFNSRIEFDKFRNKINNNQKINFQDGLGEQNVEQLLEHYTYSVSFQNVTPGQINVLYQHPFWFYVQQEDQYYYLQIKEEYDYGSKKTTPKRTISIKYYWFPRIKKAITFTGDKDKIKDDKFTIEQKQLPFTIMYDTYYYNTYDKAIWRANWNSQKRTTELKKTLLTHFQVSDYRMELFLSGAENEYRGFKYNDYYTELKSEWPKLFNILPQPQKTSVQNVLSIPIPTFYNDVTQNMSNIDYYLDLLSSSDFTSKYGINSIGKRTKIINDNKINCIFEPNCASVILLDKQPVVNTKSTIQDQALQKIKQKQEKEKIKQVFSTWNKKNLLSPLTALIEVDHQVYQNLVNGGASRSAYDEIRTALYQYISYNEQVSLTTLPIYYLEPNSLIRINNAQTNIHGNYMIKTISLPLDVNGTMSITCSKAIERI